MQNPSEWHAALGLSASDRVPATLAHLGQPAAECAAAAPGQTRHSVLPSYRVIAVHGADARSFLHAQLCGDLRSLQPGETLLTGWCSPKGRVLFLLRVLVANDGFRLLLPAEQAAACLRRLRLFVLRAAVELDELVPQTGVIALAGASPPAPLPAALTLGQAPPLSWLCGDITALGALWPQLGGTATGEDAARLANILLGLPTLPAMLSDTFLPQELDLDHWQGVSFQKGCYPGQEIIARVRFRGSVKRRLAAFTSATAMPPAAGTRLLAATTEQACGTVLDSVALPAGGTSFLAVLDMDASSVRLGEQPDTTLERLSLPARTPT